MKTEEQIVATLPVEDGAASDWTTRAGSQNSNTGGFNRWHSQKRGQTGL